MSLHALPYDIYLLLLTQVCRLGDPVSLYSFILAAPPIAATFSANAQTLLSTLITSLPSPVYEISLALYNISAVCNGSELQGFIDALKQSYMAEGVAGSHAVFNKRLLIPPSTLEEQKIMLRTKYKTVKGFFHRFAPGEIDERQKELLRAYYKDAYRSPDLLSPEDKHLWKRYRAVRSGCCHLFMIETNRIRQLRGRRGSLVSLFRWVDHMLANSPV